MFALIFIKNGPENFISSAICFWDQDCPILAYKMNWVILARFFFSQIIYISLKFDVP
jgi:hypothetical protein